MHIKHYCSMFCYINCVPRSPKLHLGTLQITSYPWDQIFRSKELIHFLGSTQLLLVYQRAVTAHTERVDGELSYNATQCVLTALSGIPPKVSAGPKP